MATLEQLTKEFDAVVQKLGHLRVNFLVEEQKLIQELAVLQKQAAVLAPPAAPAPEPAPPSETTPVETNNTEF